MILKLLLIVPAHRKNSESYQHDARIVSATPTHNRYCWLHTRTVNTKSSIRNVLLVTSSDRTSGSPVTPCDGTSMAAKKGDWITFSGGISVGDSTTRSSRPTYSIGSFACGALLFGSKQCHHSMPLPMQCTERSIRTSSKSRQIHQATVRLQQASVQQRTTS
jgi:hypothetical protein